MTYEKADLLADALRQAFTAHVKFEEISPGRFRFDVYSKHFGPISYLDRQDRAWEVVERVLDRREQMDLSLVLLMGPEDVGAELVELMP